MIYNNSIDDVQNYYNKLETLAQKNQTSNIQSEMFILNQCSGKNWNIICTDEIIDCLHKINPQETIT